MQKNEVMYYADPFGNVTKVRLKDVDPHFLLTHYTIEPVNPDDAPHGLGPACCKDLYKKKADADTAAAKTQEENRKAKKRAQEVLLKKVLNECRFDPAFKEELENRLKEL